MINAPRVFVRLDRDACPDVGGPRKSLRHGHHAVATFCQNLKRVPVSANHDIKHFSNKFIRDFPVEKIRHRINENTARPFPTQRQFESIRPQTKVKPLLKVLTRDTPESLSEGSSITAIASWRNPSTASS